MAKEDDEGALESVRAAYESLSQEPVAAPDDPEHPPTDQTPANANETPQQTADRERDEAGRFKASDKPRETLKLKDKPLADAPLAKAEAPPAAPIDPTKPVAERIAPPAEWGGLAKVKWDRLPVDVQREISQHEATRATAAAELVPLRELIDTNREFLVNQAGSVVEAQRQMMLFARMSVDNPVQLAEHILRSKGIDPRAAFAGQQAAPQPSQPQDIASLLGQLIDQRLQPVLAERETQQTQQLQTTLDTFAADPKHPFFNDVRVHMGQLIQAGMAKDLPEAYEKATLLNPTIRAHLDGERREADEAKRAEEARKAKAAVRSSVTGTPLTGAMANGKDGPHRSALDDVREAYQELSGG